MPLDRVCTNSRIVHAFNRQPSPLGELRNVFLKRLDRRTSTGKMGPWSKNSLLSRYREMTVKMENQRSISYQRTDQLKDQRTTHSAQSHEHKTHKAPTQPTDALNPIATYIHKELDPLSAEGGDSEALGRVPYFMLPQVMADTEERNAQGITPKDYGTRWRATFRGITGNAPECGPGDHETARQYARKVQTAIRQGGWTPSEWGSLSRAEKVWLRRAHGLDPRFEVVGTRHGRLTFEQRELVRAIKVSQQLAEEVNRKWVPRG